MNATNIVVGTDGSPSSRAAVQWAAREAQRRNVPLRIVHAYDWNWGSARYGGDEFRQLAQNDADVLVSDAVVQARAAAPGIGVEPQALIGNPAPVLLAAAQRAALLVVGSRGRGGFASLLLGSAGQRVATHAACPVAVVRGRPDTDGPVVVGVDDSPSAPDTLAMGFELAATRAADLIAIRAYQPPEPPWGADMQPLVYDPKQRKAEEHQSLDQLVGPWRDKYPHVNVETLVARGSAARVLTGVSHTAGLVVVGSRGHGEFAGTLLGSVGLQLLHHADCPVLISRTTA